MVVVFFFAPNRRHLYLYLSNAQKRRTVSTLPGHSGVYTGDGSRHISAPSRAFSKQAFPLRRLSAMALSVEA